MDLTPLLGTYPSFYSLTYTVNHSISLRSSKYMVVINTERSLGSRGENTYARRNVKRSSKSGRSLDYVNKSSLGQLWQQT